MRTRTLAAAARPEAREAWCALQARLGEEVGVTSSWEWTGTWLEHYGEVVEHNFVIGELEGEVRGMALIARQAGLARLRPPTIVLGTAGEPAGSSVFVERNRLLTGAHDLASFSDALRAELGRDKSWERLRLDGMTPEHAQAVLGTGSAALWQADESPIADLPALDAGAALEHLPARRRRRVEGTLELLGPLQTEWAEDIAQARSILGELIALHQARWQAEGRAGAFASPRFTAFHRELVERLVPDRRVALFRVRSEAETVACLYGLIEGRRLLFYQGGMQRHPDNRVRIGLAAHALFMRACQERGLTEYDFLAPAARYKQELSNRSERLVWAEIERPGVRLRLERAARRVKRALARSSP
jgi:CelD/BcsL family acetyltransferase involved in cellulose biosynthesis